MIGILLIMVFLVFCQWWVYFYLLLILLIIYLSLLILMIYILYFQYHDYFDYIFFLLLMIFVYVILHYIMLFIMIIFGSTYEMHITFVIQIANKNIKKYIHILILDFNWHKIITIQKLENIQDFIYIYGLIKWSHIYILSKFIIIINKYSKNTHYL